MNRRAAQSIILFIALALPGMVSADAQLSLTQRQLEYIGEKIYLNETGGNADYLIAWNDGEAFASLGIGHFIWFPAGLESPFTETFPELLSFFNENGVNTPEWLNKSTVCPWNTKEAFLSAKNTEKYHQLRTLMSSTFALQVNFIHKRMQQSLSLMVNDVDSEFEKSLIYERFNELARSEMGMYSLIDYVNFKGEGTSSKERYMGHGWGLKQVLLSMDENQDNIHQAFSDSCIQILTRRVNHSPQKDVEKKWLPGWSKRCKTYSPPK